MSLTCFYCGSSYIREVDEGLQRCLVCNHYIRGSRPYSTAPPKKEEKPVTPIEISKRVEFEKFLKAVYEGFKKLGREDEAKTTPKNLEEFNALPESEKNYYREEYEMYRSGG